MLASGPINESDNNEIVPEPAAIVVWSLLGLCGEGMALRRRRRS